jgi:hypothetical protein
VHCLNGSRLRDAGFGFGGEENLNDANPFTPVIDSRASRARRPAGENLGEQRRVDVAAGENHAGLSFGVSSVLPDQRGEGGGTGALRQIIVSR